MMGCRLAAPWLCLIFLGCASSAGPARPDGGAPAPGAGQPDAGPAAQLDRWLRWQAALAASAPRRDGGRTSPLQRARAERAALAEAGLTLAQAEAVEALVAAVVAERAAERLSGGPARASLGAALGALGPEQRAEAQAALEATARRGEDGGAFQALEARFGAAAVEAVLAREAEATRAWDSLLEGEVP